MRAAPRGVVVCDPFQQGARLGNTNAMRSDFDYSLDVFLAEGGCGHMNDMRPVTVSSLDSGADPQHVPQI